MTGTGCKLGETYTRGRRRGERRLEGVNGNFKNGFEELKKGGKDRVSSEHWTKATLRRKNNQVY